MRVPDPNLLASTAASASQAPRSPSHRSNGGDSSFDDVYKQTAVRKDRENDGYKANRQDDKSSDNDNTRTVRDASGQREKAGVEERAEAPADETGSTSKEAAAKRSALERALAEAQNMDDAALEKLAEELGMNAEDLAAALEELAKGIEKMAADAGAGQQPATEQLDDGDIKALFQLLIGQRKPSDGAKADAADNNSENAEGTGEDGEAAAKTADGTPSADDIADLLNALSNGAKTQAAQAADGDGEAQGTTTFRFERADGKGVPVELQIGGAKDGEALEDGQGSSKVENVTVLDSRRYLAPTDVNASNVVTNITGDKTWAAAMKSAPTPNMPNLPPEKVITEVNTLKIQMHPVDLGTVTATLRLKGDDLIVNMSVHNAEAFNQLNADKDKIIQSLRSQGFSVDQINIQMSATPDRAVQPSASSQQHQNGQQMSGGSDGNAARQGYQDEGRRQQSNGQNAFQTADDVPSVGGGNSGNPASDSRAGQIYI